MQNEHVRECSNEHALISYVDVALIVYAGQQKKGEQMSISDLTLKLDINENRSLWTHCNWSPSSFAGCQTTDTRTSS